MPKKMGRVKRNPNNPFERGKDIEYIPLRIVARRLQEIQDGPNKGTRGEHFRVVWEGFPLEKDDTREPIENKYGHEHIVREYEVWLKDHIIRPSLPRQILTPSPIVFWVLVYFMRVRNASPVYESRKSKVQGTKTPVLTTQNIFPPGNAH
jgi:hypothetical protein